MALWQEHEVFQFTMDTALINLEGFGIGPRTFAVFERAGYSKLGDLYAPTGQELAVKDAARAMAEAAGLAGMGYWRALAARCVGIIKRVRNPTYSEVVPEPFICPLTNEEFVDPVISPLSGITYERSAIEEKLANAQPAQAQDPEESLVATQLIENKALKNAIAHYNAKLRRFSIPMR
jgi:hypothetical protein